MVRKAVNIVAFLGILMAGSGLDTPGDGWIGCLVAVALFAALLLVANIDWFRGMEGGEYDDGRTEEDD